MEIVTKNSDLGHFAKQILAGVASPADLAFMRIEDVQAIKSDTGVLHHKIVTVPSVKAAGESSRARRFVASDEMPDRMGDIVRVRGWNLTNFRKNPVALWAHDDQLPAIGAVSEFEKDVESGKLFETIAFASAAANPMAETVFRLYEEGVLRAVSVGFVPIESYYPSDAEEREKMGLGKWGVEYRKQEQLELSCCNVPANPGCLSAKDLSSAIARLAGDGRIDRNAARELAEKIVGPTRLVFAVRSVAADDARSTEADAGNKAPDANPIEARLIALESMYAELNERVKSLSAPIQERSEQSAGDASPASDGTSREKDAGAFFEQALAALRG